jgi:hypothetical protein
MKFVAGDGFLVVFFVTFREQRNFQEPTEKTIEMETTWRADPVKVMDNVENVS